MPADRIRNYILNATNVHISLNGHYLDQAVSIAVQEQANHKMAYGYMDVDPRRPLKGRKLVVGTIGIHFRAADYFFRFLENTVGRPRANREEVIDATRRRIKEFKSDAELLAYLSITDLDSDEFEVLAEAVKKNALDEPEAILPGIEARTPDTVGEDGFNSTIRQDRRVFYHPTLNRSYLGHTIRIHYGDAENEKVEEDIIGVLFTGRAKTPIENSAGVSADPLMEYYSFIAARIDPAQPSSIQKS